MDVGQITFNVEKGASNFELLVLLGGNDTWKVIAAVTEKRQTMINASCYQGILSQGKN